MDKDLALFAAEQASKHNADQIDVRIEDHCNKLIIITNEKVQRGIINRKHRIDERTLFDGA